MGTVKRIAEGIDGLTRAVWDDSGIVMKLLVLIVLLVTFTAIPVIPIAILARWIAD